MGTDEDFTALADTLESELTSKGFVHYAHVDEGESFHVVFGIPHLNYFSEQIILPLNCK